MSPPATWVWAISGSNAGSNRAAQSCTLTHLPALDKHANAHQQTAMHHVIESRNAWAPSRFRRADGHVPSPSAAEGTVGLMRRVRPARLSHVCRKSVATYSKRLDPANVVCGENDLQPPCLPMGERNPAYRPTRHLSHGCAAGLLLVKNRHLTCTNLTKRCRSLLLNPHERRTSSLVSLSETASGVRGCHDTSRQECTAQVESRSGSRAARTRSRPKRNSSAGS